jgi:hypothetical protein
MRTIHPHRLSLLAALLFAAACPAAAEPLPDCSGGSGAKIAITNFKGGEEIGYELLFIRGTVASSATQVRVNLGGSVRAWPAAGGIFKALVPLKPGANTVGITASGHKNACLEIRYNPAQLGPSVQFLFVAGREKTEGPGLFPAFPEQSSDFASAKKRITLAALLAQTAMAELLHDAGKPRLTFNPKRNAQGEIDVRLWKSPYTTAEIEAAAARKEDVGARIREGVWAAFPEAGSKFMLYVQPSDPWPVAVANVALSTASILYSYAESLDQLVAYFHDTRSPALLGLPTQQANSRFHSDAFWKDFSCGVGSTLHELGHIFGLPHSGRAEDVMELGSYNINRLFMVSQPGGPTEPANIEWGDTSRTLLLKNPELRGPLAFKPAQPSLALERGLDYRYFEGKWERIPDMDPLVPVAQGVAPDIRLGMQRVQDGFALSFSGYLKAAKTAEYGFYLKADDGSRLYVDDSLLIDRGTPVSPPAVASLGLAAGTHRLRVDYFEWGGAEELQVLWQTQLGSGFSAIPDSVLFRKAAATALARAGAADARVGTYGRELTVVLRDPEARVVFSVLTPTGRRLHVLHDGPLPAGESRFAIPDGLPRGSLAVWQAGDRTRSVMLP